jgi:glycosyltransferase involved in cell wall biosynthesis
MPFFSLIIPVYNVEKYLAECLDSCINQTFKDIEIICINDCSPDNSDKILNKYVEKDTRIKVITHEINRKQGGARNTGIAAATGNYSWFIDPDDIIPLDACELLFSVIKRTNAEIIRFNLENFQHDDSCRLGIYTRIDDFIWPYGIIITKKDHTRINMAETAACTFITITSHLKKYKFREMVFHEDSDFVPILFSESNSIFCVNTTIYFRRLHDKSVTGGGVFMQDRIVYKLYAINSLCDYAIASKLPKSHFCIKNIQDDIIYIKNEYYKYPEIHSVEFNSIISKAEKFKCGYLGDVNLYNNIITNYGNTKLLEFILKVYRFINKRIFLLLN